MKIELQIGKSFLFGGVLLIALFAIGIWNYSQATSNEITACVKRDGTIHLINDGFKRSDCKKDEKLVTWNIQGPKGDQGIPGVSVNKGAGQIFALYNNGNGIHILKTDGTVWQRSGSEWIAESLLNPPKATSSIISWEYTSFLDSEGNIWQFSSPNWNNIAFPDGSTPPPPPAQGILQISRDGASATSKVLTAGQTIQELNRFRFEAIDDTLTLNKIRFETTAIGGITGGGGKYIKKAYLFNGATNLTPSGIVPTPNGTSSELLFDGLSVNIPMGGTTVLTFKADMGDYAVISSALDVSTFGIQVKSDHSDDLRVVGTSAGTIDSDAINGIGINNDVATSQIYLFHAATPVIAKGTVSSTTLGGSTAQELYKFTLQSATAGVPVRVGQIKVAVTTTGFSGADLIQTFELWKDGVKVAQDTTTTIGPTGTASSTATITFSSSNDVNDAFDPDSAVATALDGIEISDTAATFVVKANTTAATAAGATGTNSVTTQITGNASYDASDTDQEDNWHDGNIFYSYKIFNTFTYIGGTSSTSGFTASQSYPVDAQVLSITI